MNERDAAIARHPSGRRTTVPQLVLVPLLDIPSRDDSRDRKERP